MKFCLIGCGYIAPRHSDAIAAVGGELVGATDPHDAVGWLDAKWPRCAFIKAPDPFSMLQWSRAEWAVVCSPNRYHAEHVERAMLFGMKVICEKPLALSVSDLERLAAAEARGLGPVYTILQLRHQGEARQAKHDVEVEGPPAEARIDYEVYRGPWYDASWKGDAAKSGGTIFNIGSHPADLAAWIFGPPDLTTVRVRASEPRAVTCEGVFGSTLVRLFLSTRAGSTRRELQFGGKRYDLSETFRDLHTICYHDILGGNGPRISDVVPGLSFCERVRELT